MLHQVLEALCSRVEQFITQRGRMISALTAHQRRNKSNLLHVLLADPSVNDAVVNNGKQR
jgi:antitoxin (DNA-binding transcriptional repressor) of toxin-antitoxin stability system